MADRTDLEHASPLRAPLPGSASAQRLDAPGVAPACVYLLAENLDAVLAAGEDLMREAVTWTSPVDGRDWEVAALRAKRRAQIDTIKTLEMIVAARALKSRERAEELAKRDPRFWPMARLYTAGTAIMVEAAADLGYRPHGNFETGGGLVAYLRGRGLIAPDAASPEEGASLKLGEDFLIGRHIRLGTLMDLAAMFLDTLETHYDLFGPAGEEMEAAAD